ncbi:hypothetical protein ACMFMG_006371 [Clarireedia jacksonii]
MAFRVENGRRYQAYREGAYWAPNDELQNEHLDISHQRFLSMLDGRLFLAPIPDNIERVLDLGTGTGIWAIDFADLYANASVLGTDLSPIQPEMVPPNCRFEIDDMTEEWTYPLSHFDFIHIRSLFGSVPDWPKVYEQAFKHLKPGGFIEQIEPSLYLHSDDGTLARDNPMNRFTGVRTEGFLLLHFGGSTSILVSIRLISNSFSTRRGNVLDNQWICAPRWLQI